MKLLILLLLISCGTAENAMDNSRVNRIVRELEHSLDIKVDYPITFYTEKSSIVARCVYFGIGKFMIPWEIEINRHHFNMDDLYLKSVLAHEIGHCSLKLPHDNSSDEIGCPTSIMFPYTIPKICFKRYGMKYYIDKLKEKK